MLCSHAHTISIFMSGEGRADDNDTSRLAIFAHTTHRKISQNYLPFNWPQNLELSRTNVVMNYTEVEGKVREATNDEAWGPTGPLMQELAHATFTYEHFPEVMSMLWKRMLQDNKTNWRRTYKVNKQLDVILLLFVSRFTMSVLFVISMPFDWSLSQV